MILLLLHSFDHRERGLEASHPLVSQLLPATFSALKLFFHSELEENEVCYFAWLFWGTVWLLLQYAIKISLGFFVVCGWIFFFLCYTSFIFWLLPVTFTYHLGKSMDAE